MNFELPSTTELTKVVLLFLCLLGLTALRTIVIAKPLKNVDGISKTLPMFIVAMFFFVALNLAKGQTFALEESIRVIAIISGICLAGGWYCVAEGISKDNLSVLSPLQSLSVLFVGLISPIVMSHYGVFIHYEPAEIIGCGLILIGMLLQYRYALKKLKKPIQSEAYLQMILGAAFLSMYMISLSMVSVIDAGFNKEVFLVWAELSAIVVLIFYAKATNKLRKVTNDIKKHYFALSGIGLISAAIAYIEVYLILLVPAVLVTASKRGSIVIETIVGTIIEKQKNKDAVIRILASAVMFIGALCALLGGYVI